ncbi:taste receptor, type 2, member 200, tandem duplicate 1 [Danio rerio]|nr:taste receptor, type 2, member 200, tandem duplicate 1 [Danio rerio]AAI63688.1 Taste receptor, type 2, member 200.1 [Danio rerio]AAI63703.1 Taste receptor, type 2, member 200.1 [Danio rerio]BAE78479.1 taste receptor, type 2, member 1a [Danio rerio]BAE80438.1 bitter taste receptor [Danio rerio]|eukprot:NP_001034919.1 taste receptor, type 2, member 200, tandem duplicate 1 [Danio rerio]
MSTDVGNVLFFVGVGVVGVSGNIFNLIFSLQQQVKTRSIQTVGLILDVISISNIILVLSTLAMVVSVFLNAHIWCIKPYPLGLRFEMYLMMTCGFISFWAIAWLSLFYCIKVVNFSSEIFRTLKKNISTVINTAVTLSCLFSFLLFLPAFSLDLPDSADKNISETNITTCPQPTFTLQIDINAYAAAVLLLICPIPLMIMLPTSVRMVVHLCAHTRALQKNQTQVQGSDSYLLVCKLTISLVGVYLSTLFMVALYFIIKVLGAFMTYQALVSAFTFYCGMTSVLLTASNRYLKDKLWSLFCCRKAKEPVSKSQTVVTQDV